MKKFLTICTGTCRFKKHPFWFVLWLALLVLLPLPFGSNRPWATNLIGVLASISLVFLAVDFFTQKISLPQDAPMRRIGASAFLLFLVILWAFLQTQSWLPKSWHYPFWGEIQDIPNALTGAVSVNPDLFSESLTRILIYLSFFIMAFFAGRDAERAKVILYVLGITAVAYAFYGLLMQSTGIRKILWYDKWAYEEFVTSTFVNKNSYATYAGLGLQVCFSLLWINIKRKPKEYPEKTSIVGAWAEKLAQRDIAFLIMCFATMGALIMTGSRAGIASALLGCFAMLLALAVNRKWKFAYFFSALFFFTALFAVYLFFSGGQFFDRLDQEQMQYDVPLRIKAYAILLRAIFDNPLLGFGLGAFEEIFRIYRDHDFPLWFQHAHNDYLELAIELGIPAATAYIVSIAVMVSCCIDGIRKRKRQEIFPILAFGATITIAVHSLADFSMQIPAVAATYASILGLGVAQSWPSRKKI